MTNRAHEKRSKRIMTFAAAAVLGSATMTYAPQAHAEPVAPNGKGIVGGALLGGELVVVTEAIFGVRSPLAYGLGAGLGALAGGFAGYGVERAVVNTTDTSSDQRAPVIMLAAGLALAIPALVITLNATTGQGREGAKEDRSPGPTADPGSLGGTPVVGVPPTAPATTPAPTPPAEPAPTPAPPATPPPGGGAPAPTSLFDVTPRAFRLGMPVPQVRNVFTTQERRQMGMTQVTELHLPVVNVTF